jgi:hypothetical protein
MVWFCLSRQYHRAPVMVSGIIDFLGLKGASVARFWVRNFVHRQKQQLSAQKATAVGNNHHGVSFDDTKP